MAALTAGSKAPDFTLSTLDGKTFPLAQALRASRWCFAFFKISCPVCQYAMPFLERLQKTMAVEFSSLEYRRTMLRIRPHS